MRIHALTTGEVELKVAFLHATPGIKGKVNLLRRGQWASPPLPIHVWVIEHEEHRILVDTGEIASAKDMPFAHPRVRPQDELPNALAAAGLSAADVTTAILTHLHADHYNGARHLDGPVLVGDAEWREANGFRGRIAQRVTRAPLPAGVDFRPVGLDDGPFGAFAHSRALTPDGRVLAVATPGHTGGHLSVLAIDDDGRHVLLAGDATDTLEQLRDRRADAVATQPAEQVRTIDRILAHAAEHATVYLPSHDLESAARLAGRVTLSA
jgi:N-acyl homoserine lactone hydrolase